MFRTQNNIPEIYVNESRDYQLFCRAKDLIFGGVKYNIDSLRHTSNTMEMNGSLLPLLKSKVGFFDAENLNEEELRYLLCAFPYMIKYKGSKRAIEYILNTWLRLYSIQGKIMIIDVNNEEHNITIQLDATPKSTYILDKLFNYIIPTGYSLNYYFVSSFDKEINTNFESSFVGVTILNKDNAQIRNPITGNEKLDTDNKVALADRLIGAVGFTDIMNDQDVNIPENGYSEIEFINEGENNNV